MVGQSEMWPPRPVLHEKSTASIGIVPQQQSILQHQTERFTSISRDIQRQNLLQNRRLGAILYRLYANWGEQHDIVAFYKSSLHEQPELAPHLASLAVEEAVDAIRRLYIAKLRDQQRQREKIEEKQKMNAQRRVEEKQVKRIEPLNDSTNVHVHDGGVLKQHNEQQHHHESDWGHLMGLHKEIAAYEDRQLKELERRKKVELRQTLEAQIRIREEYRNQQQRQKRSDLKWMRQRVGKEVEDNTQRLLAHRQLKQLEQRDMAIVLENKRKQDQIEYERRLAEERDEQLRLERVKIDDLKGEIRRRRRRNHSIEEIEAMNRQHQEMIANKAKFEKEEEARLVKEYEEVQRIQEQRRQMRMINIKEKTKRAEAMGGFVIENENKKIREEEERLRLVVKEREAQYALSEEANVEKQQNERNALIESLRRQVVEKSIIKDAQRAEAEDELSQLQAAMQRDAECRVQDARRRANLQQTYRRDLDAQINVIQSRPRDPYAQMNDEERKINSRYLNSPSLDTLRLPFQEKPFALNPPRKRVDPLLQRAIDEDAQEQLKLNPNAVPFPMQRTDHETHSKPVHEHETKSSRPPSNGSITSTWESPVRPPYALFDERARGTSTFQRAAHKQIFTL